MNGKKTALCLFFLAVAGILWLTLQRQKENNPKYGESDPQLVDVPGSTIRGKELWGEGKFNHEAPINPPRYISAEEARQLLVDGDGVYLVHDGASTAVFPEVLLTAYHVVNDVIDGEPVSVTFCLLAGSAALFSRRLEGQVLSLGLTGHLYCGNSVLNDEETRTEWLQLNGEPISGPWFGKARLRASTLERSTWGAVKDRPGIRVLAPIRDMAVYRQFHRELLSEKLGLKAVQSQRELDRRLLPYTKGLAIRVQEETRFYPESLHGEKSLLADKVGGWAILVLSNPLENSSRIFRRQLGDRCLEFELKDRDLVDRQTSSRWRDDGTCVAGPLAGSRLELPFHTSVYWFAWSSLYPGTSLPP